jgi:hypothetical protein
MVTTNFVLFGEWPAIINTAQDPERGPVISGGPA